jgi:predicted enzyme related to lactoylglutathione lyase
VERVTGIGGIFFRSRDPQALAQWYAAHLGISVDPSFGGSVLRWDVAGSTVWAPFPADTGYFGRADQAWMVNFRVIDLDAMLAQLRAAGVTVDDHIEEQEFGRFGWAVDPDGNRFELWQPAPGH